MNKILKYGLGMLIAALPIQNSHAQTIERQVIGGSGGTYSSTAIQADYTVGEALTTTLLQGSFLLTQGFQQQISGEATGIVTPNIKVGYSLYPNPAEKSITLELNSDAQGEVLISIVNVLGQQLYIQNKPVSIYPNYKQTFSIAHFAAGSYFINIFNMDGGLLHALKFIKKE